MSWADIEVQMSGGKYLRIEPGKSADIHMITKGENVKRKFVHYDGQKYHDCMGKTCMNCTANMPRSEKYIAEVFDRADKTVKTFEFGANILIGIKEIAKVLKEDGQTIHDIDLRISRVSEKPVRYQVVQRKNAGPVPSETEMKNEDDESVPF